MANGLDLSSNAEAGIGIICACLPAMTTLVASSGPERSSQRRDQSVTCQELSKVRSFRKSASRSQTDGHRADPDEAFLVAQAQGDPEIETSIMGDAGTRSQRHMHPFDAHGILKTVDVSHTVVFTR